MTPTTDLPSPTGMFSPTDLRTPTEVRTSWTWLSALNRVTQQVSKVITIVLCVFIYVTLPPVDEAFSLVRSVSK